MVVASAVLCRRVYQYDLWNDYLKPYFKAHPLRSYAVNDVFDYHGVVLVEAIIRVCVLPYRSNSKW